MYVKGTSCSGIAKLSGKSGGIGKSEAFSQGVTETGKGADFRGVRKSGRLRWEDYVMYYFAGTAKRRLTAARGYVILSSGISLCLCGSAGRAAHS